MWRPLLLAACGLLSAQPAGAVAGTNGTEVSVYLGCGCFWHVQHAFVQLEMSALHRSGQAVTARAAYAGSKRTGPGGRVCYHNFAGVADYGTLGHAEVVALTVPAGDFPLFAAKFWAICPKGQRQDPQDMGPEYRSVVGLPGGLDSPLLPSLRAGADGTSLLPGRGGDDDTLDRQEVLVYDSEAFPAYVAERAHQFHDDMLEAYSEAYHELREHAAATRCPMDERLFSLPSGLQLPWKAAAAAASGAAVPVGLLAVAGALLLCRSRRRAPDDASPPLLAA